MSKGANNGFAIFMQDYRKKAAKEGRKFRNLSEVVPYAGEIWSQMSADEKRQYKQKAREYKTSEEYRYIRREIRSRPPNLKTTMTSRPLSKVVKNSGDDDSFTEEPTDVFFFDKDDDDKMFLRREEDRNGLKLALSWNLRDTVKDLPKHSFFIISVQNYYEAPNYDFQPCELAFIEFSMSQGITKTFNAIFKPMNIAPAFKSFALETADHTHQISIENPPSCARDNYRRIVEDVKNFYQLSQPNNSFRAFCLTKQFNSVQGACKAIRDKTGSKLFIPQNKISCVEDLLTLLYQFKEKPVPREQYLGFLKLLKSTPYDLEPTTLCDFHKQCQSKYCALAIARKTCYHLFECLQGLYNFEITPSHTPILYNGMTYYADADFSSDNGGNCSYGCEDEEDLTSLVACGFPKSRHTDDLATAKKEVVVGRTSSKHDDSFPSTNKFDDFPDEFPQSFEKVVGYSEANAGLANAQKIHGVEKRAAELIALAKCRGQQASLKRENRSAPPGIENVKWEPGPTFSIQQRRYITSASSSQVKFDMHDQEDDEIEHREEQIGFSANSCQLRYGNDLQPFQKASAASSYGHSLNSMTNDLNSLTMDEVDQAASYNNNPNSGAVPRTMLNRPAFFRPDFSRF